LGDNFNTCFVNIRRDFGFARFFGHRVFPPSALFSRYVCGALFVVVAMRKVLHATIRLPIL
jgi:hypothetical protein